jgi:hypothetical protein
MLKLVSGTLIGGVNYKKTCMVSDLDDETNPQIESNNMAEHRNTNIHKPTLPKTARKVARLEKRELDEKQYITYEIILACIFLLGLIHDCNNPTTTLYSCLGQTMGSTATLEISDIVRT